MEQETECQADMASPSPIASTDVDFDEPGVLRRSLHESLQAARRTACQYLRQLLGVRDCDIPVES